MNRQKNYGGVFWFAVLGAVVIIVVGAVTGPILSSLRKGEVFLPEIALPIIMIIGLGVLLIVLSIMTAMFSAQNLANSTEALGLPEGSVRAVIALSLILLFSIMALFLYTQLANEETATLQNVSEEYLNKIPTDRLLGVRATTGVTPTVYTVDLRVEKSQASEDFAKQILTTVSTLVVALAGFYFGTRAVATSRGVTVSSEPVIRSIDPPSREPGEVQVAISGKNFQSPKTVRLDKGQLKIEGQDITASDTKITCKFTIGNDKDHEGKWALTVVNEDGGEDTVPDLFEVQAKTEGPVKPEVKTESKPEETPKPGENPEV